MTWPNILEISIYWVMRRVKLEGKKLRGMEYKLGVMRKVKLEIKRV